MLRAVLLLMLGATAVGAVMGTSETEAKAKAKTKAKAKSKIKVRRIRVKSNYGKIVHVGKGKKIRVSTTVTVRPNKAANKGVRYRSGNKRIARVSSGGWVRGIKVGTTRVYAVSKKNKKKKGSIKVRVVKPLTKIILSEKEKTVKVGDKFTLKKKVVPSDSGFKTVVWKSSASSVAKVSSAGRVTALRPGNAKITAKAVDGSGTKAVCSVKVQSVDTVNMTSVRALNGVTVRVQFDREISLAKDNFSVSGRSSATGSYNKSYVVRRIRNYGGTTYDLTLRRGHTIEKGSLLRVGVGSLPGNGTKAIEAEAAFVRETKPEDRYVRGEEGTYITPYTFDLSEYGYGALVYDVGTLPDGIRYDIRDNRIIFTGKTKQSYFGKTTTILAVDERDREIKANVYWYIGSKDDIVGYAKNLSLVAGEEISGGCGRNIFLAGGSGRYRYAFTGLPAGIKGDPDTGEVTGVCQTAGTYHIQAMVTDRDGDAGRIAVSFDMIVESGYTLWGEVKDAQGLPMPEVKVEFVGENAGGLSGYAGDFPGDGGDFPDYAGDFPGDFSDVAYSAVTDSEGRYSVRVVGDVYYGTVAVNETGRTETAIRDDICEYSVKGDACVDFSLECSRVTLSYDQDVYTREEPYWNSRIIEGAVYEGDSLIYVANGPHDIFIYAKKRDPVTGIQIPCILEAEFTVSGAGISVDVREAAFAEENSDEKPESGSLEEKMEDR